MFVGKLWYQYDRFGNEIYLTAERWQHIIDRLLGRTSYQDVDDSKMTAASTLTVASDFSASAANIRLTPIQSSGNHFRFTTVLLAELRLALKGLPWWWFAAVLGIFIAELVNPIETGLQIALAAMVWPILVLSALGTREGKYHTHKIVFSAAFPLRRQLPATWLAGVLITALISIGIALRLAMAAEWVHLLGIIAGTLFVPSLALALGVWSGVNRLFEVVFLFWWYMALNGLPALDFLAAVEPAPTLTLPLAYLVGAIALLATAVIGRQVKLQN